MHDLAQQIVSGLATGSIFASMALALVLIYRARGIINFAQGEMAMFTTYIAWQLAQTGSVSCWLKRSRVDAFGSTGGGTAFTFGGGGERLCAGPPRRSGQLWPRMRHYG